MRYKRCLCGQIITGTSPQFLSELVQIYVPFMSVHSAAKLTVHNPLSEENSMVTMPSASLLHKFGILSLLLSITALLSQLSELVFYLFKWYFDQYTFFYIYTFCLCVSVRILFYLSVRILFCFFFALLVVCMCAHDPLCMCACVCVRTHTVLWMNVCFVILCTNKYVYLCLIMPLLLCEYIYAFNVSQRKVVKCYESLKALSVW